MANEKAAVVVIGETQGGTLRPQAQELFSAGRMLADTAGGTLAVVVAGQDIGAAATEAAELGADIVLVADSEDLHSFTLASRARVAQAAIETLEPSLVLLPATTAGRDIAPYLSARLRVPHLADVIRIEFSDGSLSAVRPVYGGKMLTEVRPTSDGPVLITIRTGTYAAPERQSGRTANQMPLDVALADADNRVRVIDLEASGGGSVNLEAADVVVVGGRGLGSEAGFALVDELASAAGGVVGATRAVTDLGWRPHYDQVGQTGKTISPKLYIGVGVSGAVQHTVGIRGSETIVAINRDQDAPIFKLADFGVVGDLFEILPKLTERLRQERGG